MDKPAKLPISVFIITKNEQDRLSLAIRSVINWADEVIVIDSGSTDDTVKIAENLGAKVLYNEWRGYVAQKIFGESLCRNKWILNIDADEQVSLPLAEEIRQLFLSKEFEHIAYKIKITIVHRFDKTAKLFAPYNNVIRLYNRDFAGFCFIKEESTCHDSVFLKNEIDAKKIGQLKKIIYHRSVRSISHAIEKANYYSSMQASDMATHNRPVSIIRLLCEFPVCFLKAYFLRNYFIFGLEGFTDSMVYAFSRFIRLAKLRENHLRKKFEKSTD